MTAKNLAEAVRIQNGTDYGLTAGLQSLDPSEQSYWSNHVVAGNKYINRGTTGAIVQRQPFGGLKRSAVGPGFKAGGNYYLYGFGVWKKTSDAFDENRALPVTEEQYPTLEKNLHVYRTENLEPQKRIIARGELTAEQLELLKSPDYYLWPHDEIGDAEFEMLTKTREESISITNHRFGAPLE